MSERFELADEPFGDAFGVAFAEVVAAEVVVDLAGAEHVSADADDRVLDGAFAGLPGASVAGGLVVAGALAGQLLCTIHGVQRRTAEVIIAEISIDMSIFATAKQLASSSHVVARPPRAGRATRRP